MTLRPVCRLSSLSTSWQLVADLQSFPRADARIDAETGMRQCGAGFQALFDVADVDLLNRQRVRRNRPGAARAQNRPIVLKGAIEIAGRYRA